MKLIHRSLICWFIYHLIGATMRYLERFVHFALLALGLLCLALIARPAFAQEGCESAGDGAVAQQKAAVKRIDDSYRVSWQAPTELADAACTPIASDPAFALTSYEVFVSLDGPVSGLPAVTTLPATQTAFEGSVAGVEGVKPGSDIYFAVTACYQFGCSALSEQEWVKVGGPPGKARSLGVE